MRAAAAIALVAAALIVAPPASGGPPLAVNTSLVPHWLFFADAVTAHVDVVFDPRRFNRSTIRLETSFAPWEQVGVAHVSDTGTGTRAHRSWRFTLSCLSIDCLPRGTALQRFRLAPVRVIAEARSGARVVMRRRWPLLKIAGRFQPATTVGLRPVFRLDTTAPAASYRVDPDSLTLALDIVGALAVALAVGLGALELAGWRSRRRTVSVTPPLVRALELLRQAQGREPDDRRRAASLVARTLPRTGSGVASVAAEIAWAPPEPAPDRLDELARAIEADLEESR